MNSPEIPHLSISEFINVMVQLRNQQKYLEKLTESSIFNVKNSFSTEYINSRQNLLKRFQNESQLIKNRLIAMICERKALKKNIMDKNKLRKLDMSYFKNSILNLEQNIYTMKLQSNTEIERLRCEESELNCDLNKLLSNKDLLSEENNDNFKKELTIKKQWKVANDCKSKEVADFMDFIHKNGGHEGGWGVDDHQIFVKYYHQNEKNIINLIKILSQFLPEKSDETVIEHVEWYLEYQDKKENYKRAIWEWRENKNKQKLNQLESKPIVTLLPETRVPVTNKKIDNKNLKEKIKEWKEKRMKNIKDEKKNLSEKNKQQKQLIDLTKRLEIKTKVAKWKETKLEMEKREREELMRLHEIEKQIRMDEAKKLIKEYQLQDRYYLARRNEMKSVNSKENQMERLKIRSKSMINVNRDPDRLHRATKQWLAKIRQPFDENLYGAMQPPSLLHVNNIPKLRKPDWIGTLPCI